MAISVNEAGRRGGAAVKARYGHDHFVAIGAKGGTMTLRRHGKAFYRRLARKRWPHHKEEA
jgi:hypothetical protein